MSSVVIIKRAIFRKKRTKFTILFVFNVIFVTIMIYALRKTNNFRNENLSLFIKPYTPIMRPEFQHEYYVALGVVKDTSRLFIASINALVWQNLGVHPLIFLIGTEAEYERRRSTQYIVDFLVDIGARTFFVSSNGSMTDHMVAQTIRLLAAGTPRTYKLDGNSMIITADFNVLVTNIDNYVLGIHSKEQDMKAEIQMSNPNCYKWNTEAICTYSTHTLTMSTNNWLKFMGIEKYEIIDGNSVVDYVNRVLGDNFLHQNPFSKIDDALFNKKLSQFNNKSQKNINKFKTTIHRLLLDWKAQNYYSINKIDYMNISNIDEFVLTDYLSSDANWKFAKTVIARILDKPVCDLLQELRNELITLLKNDKDQIQIKDQISISKDEYFY